MALAVLLWGVNLAGRAVTTEETATSSTEIVAETAAIIDATGHIADIPVVPLADAVTTADGIASTLTILGMAKNQLVMPGFAEFHVGIQTDEATVDGSDIDAIAMPPEGGNDDYVDGMSE